MGIEQRSAAIEVAEQIRAVPYVWPGGPDAEAVRRTGVGTCASKHALLAEELEGLGIASAPLLVVGPLVPEQLLEDPTIGRGCRLVEVHEMLTVLTPWAGPVRVDISWDQPLVAKGLPGGSWDGSTDMVPAVGDTAGPGWSVPPAQLRAAKEALRSRLYTRADRELRDAVLGAMSARFELWRADSALVG